MCILHCGLVLATDFEDLSSHSGQSVTSTSNVLSDAIQVETELLDNDCNPSEFQERGSIWVKVEDISLTNYDKDTLVNGESFQTSIPIWHREF